MVTRLLLTLLTATLYYASTAMAETTLNASVDRQKIYETDTLNLRITGNVDVEFSFGGLLNFGRNQIKSPDLSALQSDFDILDQQQSYNMQTINGQTTSEVTWNFVLAPRNTGQLLIPAITYDGAETSPISVEVVAGSAPKDADNPPLVFLEVEVDKSSAYVQEQVTFTTRLYSVDGLASGDWSEPEPTDAIVESLGETNKYYRMAYNQRYEVRERKYLLFPQKSGSLTIEPQSFSGILIDSRNRRRVRVRESSEPLSIDVKAPPASFTGELWLPAQSLAISEEWNQNPDEISVGDSLTRTLEIVSLGLLGSALPPLTMSQIDGLKIYPDQPDAESLAHQSGVQSRRTETTALVAVSAGQILLPEIQLPWWDTVNDVQRTAVIPARTINIKPVAQDSAKSSSAPLNSPRESEPRQEASPSSPVTPLAAEQNQDTEAFSTGEAPDGGLSDTLWTLLVLIICAGWASHAWWLTKRKADTTQGAEQETTTTDKLDRAVRAIREQDADMPVRVIDYLRVLRPLDDVRTIRDIEALDAQLYAALRDFETSRYSAIASQTQIDSKALIKTLKAFGKSPKDNASTKALPELYPGA